MFNPRHSNESRTLWCGNLSSNVSDAVLYELFNQGGPLDAVRRPKDSNGCPKSFAFIVYKHESSVPYALQLFSGTRLFNRVLNLNARGNTSVHVPVLDTHLTDDQLGDIQPSVSYPSDSDHLEEHKGQNKHHRSRSSSGSRSRSPSGSRSRSPSVTCSKFTFTRHTRHFTPQSWTEYNALKGKGSLANNLNYRTDLLGSSEMRQPNNSNFTQNFNFDQLLQMGQQMIMPQLAAVPRMGCFNPLSIPVGSPVPYMPIMNPSTSTGEPVQDGYVERGYSKADGYGKEEVMRDDRYNRRKVSRDDRRESRRDGSCDRQGSERGDSYNRHDRRRNPRMGFFNPLSIPVGSPVPYMPIMNPSTSTGEPVQDSFVERGYSKADGYGREEVMRDDRYDRREGWRDDRRESRRDGSRDRQESERGDGYNRHDRRRDHNFDQDSRESRNYHPYDRRQNRSYNQSSHGRERSGRKRD